MSLVIATGSNLGNKMANLEMARVELSVYFKQIAQSRIYRSRAVDYTNQPDFYNQVLEFEIPKQAPCDILKILLSIESKMGRTRLISKGPRTIDLDILFIGEKVLSTPSLTIPHPALFSRSFVVLPLSELPIFDQLKSKYHFQFEFEVDASPLS